MSGDPSRIRTCNPRSRNPLLYPVELWDRLGGTQPGYPPYRLSLSSTANMKNPLSRQAGPNRFPRASRPRQTAGHCLWSAPDTKPAAGTPPGGAAGTVWTAKAMHATFSQADIHCHQSVTFSRTFRRYAAMSAQGAPS